MRLFTRAEPLPDADMEAFVRRVFDTNDDVFYCHLDEALAWARDPDHRVLVRMVINGELDVSLKNGNGFVHLRAGPAKRGLAQTQAD